MVGGEVGFLNQKVSHPCKEPQFPMCKYKLDSRGHGYSLCSLTKQVPLRMDVTQEMSPGGTTETSWDSSG